MSDPSYTLPEHIVPLNPLADATSGGLHPQDTEWLTSSVLSVVVVGASGDLAKKKTFPSLLDLYDDNLLPSNVHIYGYARSKMTDEELRDRLRPFLLKSNHAESVVERFLSRVTYHYGDSYGDIKAFADLTIVMEQFEQKYMDQKHWNRLFYFAIPPSVYAEVAIAVKQTSMQSKDKGWTRLIVEKPFGRDLESFEELNAKLSEHFSEEHIYRIDHYLGKELVQNLYVLRFSNMWFERIWNRENIKCVLLTFKEPFGTEGRGGYFDDYGIIRDICQNHLLQVLTLLAMETPTTLEGAKSGKNIRDAKVAVLNAIPPIQIEDVILGQYEGYTNDETIANKDTNTPTFVTLLLKVNTPRWYGVPFIMKAGKALNERKAEVRVQFQNAPAAEYLFPDSYCPPNELVMRMQPQESIYMKTNVKSPGFSSTPVQSELEVNYDARFFSHQKETNPDAYTRLVLDVLQGKHAHFVREDELRRAWEIFSPLLHKIEKEKIRPIIYTQGTRGPPESDQFISTRAGYVHNDDYVWYESAVSRKTEGTNQPPETGGSSSVPEPIRDSELCDVGLFGLSVMGQNFALNMAQHGFKVCVSNRSPDKVTATVERAKVEGNLPIVGAKDPKDLLMHLRTPRKVIILVQAGKPVDDTIASLARWMSPGDVIIDGGNEWFPNSINRAKYLEPKGIRFIGMGISGGEEGARNGPSLMPGGPKEAYDLIAPILTKCAAQVERTGACAGYIGPVGSGNYVKMVHNGIEYGDMQLIAEVYDVLKTLLGLGNEEIAAVFDEWNKGELSSYLIEITGLILCKLDDQTGVGYVVDYVLDKTGMKGTGKWTVQEGADKGVAIPTLSAALDARELSALKEEREAASLILTAPEFSVPDNEQVINDLRAALYASKVCSYAQGLCLIKAASDEYGWNIDISECARLWTGGCIIRAQLLEHIMNAFVNNKDLKNLIVDPGFAAQLNERSSGWRRLVALCITNGLACPSLCSSLTYYDTYRRGRLPANLTQAQRDFFGGHTFERTDMPGHFHTAWTDKHKDIGDTNKRILGETLQT